MKQFKPLLAVNYEPDKLRYPGYASPKIDGIRAIVLDGKLVSRKLKPIPNRHIQESFKPYLKLLEGFDGELVVDSPISKFWHTSSGVMSEDGKPNFFFMVFDQVSERPYHQRLNTIQAKSLPDFAVVIAQVLVHDSEELEIFESKCLKEGFEGVMIRDPNGKYKYGRSTVNEGILLKVKRFEDDEAEVIGFEEQLHNGNEAVIDELGHIKRSFEKAGLSAKGLLGALVVKSSRWTESFNIGTGFDDADRLKIWQNREKYLGEKAKFRFQPHGTKDSPRFPSFLGFRDVRDM